ncbi:MAG: FAD-dependent monooxygenase [Bdellovibrionota bacterium]
MEKTVLIAGAGPTGLVLALWLTRSGVRVRIIDSAPEPGTTSRAMVVHARTLELYRQLGIADQVVAQGIKFTAANLWVKGEKRARIPLGDIGGGTSPYPYVLVFPQDRHERFLTELLAKEGVTVERSTTLLSAEIAESGVRAKIRKPDGTEEFCAAEYLTGCDGAHSCVRELIGAGFPGGTYPDLYYVADVEASGPVMNNELNVAIDDADFVAIFPLQGHHSARFVGQLRQSGADPKTLRWEDVSPRIFHQLGVNVEKVNWFSSYHVHHRVSAHFRRKCAFILGDAAHIHSPVGGQGMNTGIGDAVNLAWKLAEVLKGRAPESILDSYEPERIAFARKLVGSTDRAFRFVTARGPIAAFVRTRLVPLLVPALLRTAALQRFAFRTISQTGITYRACSFNAGSGGPLKGGDRLPWVEGADNFKPLESRRWQIHVYGKAPKISGVPVREFSWSPPMEKAGLLQNKIYLVRPDGYIALICSEPDELGAFLRDRGIKT